MIDKLILGTVQLGIKYGINNSGGKVDQQSAFRILETAYTNGIRFLDTADRYGEASDVIGAFHKQMPDIRFEVITKFEYETGMDVAQWLGTTLNRLQTEHLFCCMCPVVKDTEVQNDLLQQLLVLQEKGSVRHIGYSLYTNEELANTISDPRISLIQIPFNLLDNKNIRQDLFEEAKKAGKIIHTRSVFLQGLFHMQAEKIPGYLAPLSTYLESIKQIASQQELTVTELALGYALTNGCIDGVLIGVDNTDQLISNIDASKAVLTEETIQKINDLIVKNTDLLDPRNWK